MIAVFFIIWLSLSNVVGTIATKKDQSFWEFFFLSVFLSLLIGISIVFIELENADIVKQKEHDSGKSKTFNSNNNNPTSNYHLKKRQNNLTFDWIYLTDIKSEVDKELSNKVVSNQLKQVKSLVNATQDVGFKSVIWNVTNDNGNAVSAGVYLYQIQAGDFVQTRKMIFLK